MKASERAVMLISDSSHPVVYHHCAQHLRINNRVLTAERWYISAFTGLVTGGHLELDHKAASMVVCDRWPGTV